jgi:acyl-CoA hydrolase
MNRISTTAYRNRLQAFSAAILVGMIALTGAMWMTLTVPAEPQVVQLDRVVISGVRTPDPVVAQLPRVVIEGKRNAMADGAQMASACTAPAVC